MLRRRLLLRGVSTRRDNQVDRRELAGARRPGERLFAFWTTMGDLRRAMAGQRRRRGERCHAVVKKPRLGFGDCSYWWCTRRLGQNDGEKRNKTSPKLVANVDFLCGCARQRPLKNTPPPRRTWFRFCGPRRRRSSHRTTSGTLARHGVTPHQMSSRSFKFQTPKVPRMWFRRRRGSGRAVPLRRNVSRLTW